MGEQKVVGMKKSLLSFSLVKFPQSSKPFSMKVRESWGALLGLSRVIKRFWGGRVQNGSWLVPFSGNGRYRSKSVYSVVGNP